MAFKKKQPYIYSGGRWIKVKPVIFKNTDMGKIPFNALVTRDGVPFLTKDKEFFLVNPNTPGLTPESANNYILEEKFNYITYIY